MKKTVRLLLIVALVSIMLLTSLLVGCKRLTPDEGFDAIQAAIEHTLSGHNPYIFYWKESFATPREGTSNLVVTTTANVLCDIDRDYNFVKKNNDLDYSYDNIAGLKARVTKSYDGKTVYELFCGVNEDGNSTLAERGSLDSTTALGADFKDANNKYTFQDITAEAYTQSQAFSSNYSLEVKLAELRSLKREDLIIEEGAVEKKINVTTIKCKLSDSYCQSYREANGTNSVLEGKYVVIELSYDRIASITVYQKDPAAGDSNATGILALEYESYKFEVVYTGPKFVVPAKTSENSK